MQEVNKRDKRLKKLGRSDLIEIIYQLQKRETELLEENQSLKIQLEESHNKIAEVGSIADASRLLSEIFDVAQKAADSYQEEARQLLEKAEDTLARSERRAIETILETRIRCRKMLANTSRDGQGLGSEEEAVNGQGLDDEALSPGHKLHQV